MFTVYTRAGVLAFKVISHSKQLALSACARNSQGKMWCGTCHDPHPQVVPTSQTYNARCRTCPGELAKPHPAGTNCVSCHMTRRPAQDGGHTVFTDHRLTRRPDQDELVSEPADLKAWRDPEPALQARIWHWPTSTLESPAALRAEIARGYRMLTEAQRTTPDDVDVLKGIGRALLLGGKLDALKAFEWVLRLMPNSAASKEAAGVAFLQSGQIEKAASHFGKVPGIGPTAAVGGGRRYKKLIEGRGEKADALADRMRRTMLNLPKKLGR